MASGKNSGTATIVRGGGAGGLAPAPFLFLVLNAENLGVSPFRYRLSETRNVVFKRSESLGLEPEGDSLSVHVPDPSISSLHARIYVGESGHWWIRDEGSKNGTLVNGKVCRERKLSDGDLIEVGATFFLFHTALLSERSAPTVLYAKDMLSTPTGLRTLHPELDHVFSRVAKLAPSLSPILVCGPTGTGKELVARSVHALSQREGRFVPVNSGAIAETLLESELFGHRKGAFSGATQDKEGLLTAADGGTLFLDEVGELSPRAQVTLLRALQEGEVLPVGATKAVQIDLRVVAATNRDLVAMVEAGDFREDLLARLDGFSVLLPTLANRRVDVGLIAASLLSGATAMSFTVDGARFLLEYEWPRNARELEKALTTAEGLSGGEAIDVEHLRECVGVGSASLSSDSDRVEVDPEQLDTQLKGLLAEHGGNISRVAEVLGKKRQQIQRWCKKYGIDASLYRTAED